MVPWAVHSTAAAAVVWLLLLFTAPVVWTPLSAVLYAGGSLICHQLSDRSFHLWGAQLPVCARCLGLYAGGAAGSAALAAALGRATATSPRAWAPVRTHAWTATTLAALPTLVTFGLEWGAGLPVSNLTRSAAALPLGAAVAVVVLTVPTLHYGSCVPPRPIGSSPPPTST